MSRRPPFAHPIRLLIAMVVVLGLAGGAFLWLQDDPAPTPASELASESRIFASNDPLERACDLSDRILTRVWRGDHDERSWDLMMVPHYPNYSGMFDAVNHSGPWDYLTTVPLVLYGPDRIAAAGEIEEPVNVTDVFPTIGELTDTEMPQREGRVLDEALTDAPGVPKLIITMVWDGAGRNVLAEWPGRWPFLERLSKEGTSYLEASVGSSPTITPAIHSNLGTGAYPVDHGVPGIYYRGDNGDIVEAFAKRDPSDLELTTYADEVDQAYGNQSLVGMVASRSWHIGMFSHGSNIPGGDEDQLGIFRTSIVRDPGAGAVEAGAGYSIPESLTTTEWSRLEEYGDELDRADGEADGEWLGHPVLTGDLRDNPAWVQHEYDAIIRMLDVEGYGADEVPDLFFTNLKMADTIGHHYLMDSPEMEAVLDSLDQGLERLVDYLDREVGDYVVVLTADHGHTLPARRTGAWPVGNGRLLADINEHFDIPKGESLVPDTVAVGLFFDRDVMEKYDVTEDEIARYVNAYTIRDNWDGDELPPGYEDRGDENIFAAAWPVSQMDEVMECRFGSATPPKGTYG
jgi:predicted AlkP superfamily pyrophosphatase or phosphodiesterase